MTYGRHHYHALRLTGNLMGDTGLKAFTSSLSIRSLQLLYLAQNHIRVFRPLELAILSGRLPNLEVPPLSPTPRSARSCDDGRNRYCVAWQVLDIADE